VTPRLETKLQRQLMVDILTQVSSNKNENSPVQEGRLGNDSCENTPGPNAIVTHVNMTNSQPQTTQSKLTWFREYKSAMGLRLMISRLAQQQNRPSGVPLATQSNQFQQQGYRAKLQASTWLLQKLWEFELSRSIAGWDFKLRSYNVVPNSSEVYGCVMRHDIDGLLRLFDKKKASPFDIVRLGNFSYTLVDVWYLIDPDFQS
jgi:hypothetical protein